MRSGAATYIVGPVTGADLGASSEVMALSIAAGLVKSILVMIITPFIALNSPRSAIVFGGLIGTSSGVAAGLAATDEKLVPYGCITAAFYTALGCLLGPSLLYFAVVSIVA